MNPRTRIAAAMILGTLAGVVLGCAGMYFFFLQPFAMTWTHSGYNSEVSAARLTALELQLLREGETPKLLNTLEGELDGHLVGAGLLEESEPKLRDHQAEEAISAVRQYRAKYPATYPPGTDGATVQKRVHSVLERKPMFGAAP